MSVAAIETPPVHARRHTVKQGRKPQPPRPGCPLCQLGHTEDLLVQLHEARQLRNEAQVERINELLAGTGITADQERQHHKYHRPPQPTPRTKAVRDRSDQTDAFIRATPKRSEILDFIGRAKKVSPQQIARLFFNPDHIEPVPRTRQVQAWYELQHMASRHLVYRVWVKDYLTGTNHQLYGLGLAGAEWKSQTTDRSWDWIASNSPADVGYKLVMHDLQTNDLVVCLDERAGGRTLPNGVPVLLTVSLRNYFTAHDLTVGITGQDEYVTELNKLGRLAGKKAKKKATTGETEQSTKRFKELRPDAITAVGMDLEQPSAHFRPSSFNPLVIEYDTGVKSDEDVADQLVAHQLIARSGALLRRLGLAQYAPEGYAIPLCLVFDHKSRQEHLAFRRLERIFDLFRRKMEKVGLPPQARLWAIYAPTFHADDFLAAAAGPWDEPDKPAQDFITRLVLANRQLNETDRLGSGFVFDLDPTTDVPVSEITKTRQRQQEARREEDDKAEATRQKIAQLRRESEALVGGGPR